MPRRSSYLKMTANGILANKSMRHPKRQRGLPDQFECELNLAGRGLSGSQESRTLSTLTGFIKSSEVVRGRSEIGAVENIENFRPELGIETLRDTSHVIVLKNREIQFRKARTNYHVSAQVAAEIRAILHPRRKCGRRVRRPWEISALGCE